MSNFGETPRVQSALETSQVLEPSEWVTWWLTCQMALASRKSISTVGSKHSIAVRTGGVVCISACTFLPSVRAAPHTSAGLSVPSTPKSLQDQASRSIYLRMRPYWLLYAPLVPTPLNLLASASLKITYQHLQLHQFRIPAHTAFIIQSSFLSHEKRMNGG
jgi:hypothetical protein